MATTIWASAHAGMTVSPDGLTITFGSYEGAAIASVGYDTGKRQFRITATDNTPASFIIGLGSAGFNPAGAYVGNNTGTSFGYNSVDGKLWVGGSGSAYATTFTDGDVIDVTMDQGTGFVHFWKNGVDLGAYNMGALTGVQLFPVISFGTALASGSAVADFSSTAIPGFSAWNGSSSQFFPVM